jgi:hypothetical protein
VLCFILLWHDVQGSRRRARISNSAGNDVGGGARYTDMHDARGGGGGGGDNKRKSLGDRDEEEVVEGEGTDKAAAADDEEHAHESKKGRICRVSWACGSTTSHKSVYSGFMSTYARVLIFVP